MIDCPHCFQSVFPFNDVCPSCQQNVLDETTHGLVKIQIDPKTKFGECCCFCNMPTRNTKKIVDWSTSESYADDKFGGTRILLYIFTKIFLPVSLFLPRQGGMTRNYSKQRFRIPVCANCKNREIEVVESFPEHNKICVAVSREFAEKHIA